jgi:hypothetical protein
MKGIQIYPTLIDSFNYFLSSEHMSLQEMIDRINRVPTPFPDAARKGTALNDMIDAMLAGEVITPKNVLIRGQEKRVYNWQHNYEEMGVERSEPYAFDCEVVDELLENLAGASCQVYTQGTIRTSHGNVRLYGYLDYVVRDKAIDLKSTSRYSWPKFQNNFQHRCYLYTLRNEGIEVEQFQYLVTDFREVYKEDYFWNGDLERSILPFLERFLEFVDQHIDQIRDEKVLGISDY